MSHEPIRPEDGRGSAELDKQMTATSRHLPDNSTSPLVSICIPTFNAVRWILVCLESALAQTYPHLEVLIIDDGSTDETVELIRSVNDERIRLLVNEQNIGLARNWNKCVEMSRGNFIKFLFHDDILYPECVERMMRLLLSNENVGLVFSPRDVIVEGDPEAELTKTWLQNCTTLHTRFHTIEPVNRGRDLFTQYLDRGLRGNWIGEPSSVLIRKECFTRLGLFNPTLHQVCDIEIAFAVDRNAARIDTRQGDYLEKLAIRVELLDAVVVKVGDKEYRVLLASVTYFKAKPGDQVSVNIPEDSSVDAEWAALEAAL